MTDTKVKNPVPEPGQVWADRDERSMNSGEFTVLQVKGAKVQVQRPTRRTWIQMSRFALTSQRGYRYIGRTR